MKKSNALKGIVAAGLALTTALTLSGCSNKRMMNLNNRAGYVVIEEGNNFVLHEVKSWVNESNNIITITTDCCNNNIWTTHENAVLYKEKPSENAYTAVCDHIHE